MGGLRALATAALYLVLLSNGLHHSENLPVKFGFSPIDTPANIAKKLPSQRCPQLFLIAFFNFSHKWPTFAFAGKSGHRKIAHNGPHAETGAFPPPATARLCASSEIFYSATLLYTYISRFSVNPHYQQQLHLRPFFIAFFNFSHKRPTFDFTGEIEYTLGFRRKIARSGSHAETCVPLMWRFWGAHAILMVTGKRSKIFLFFLKIV